MPIRVRGVFSYLLAIQWIISIPMYHQLSNSGLTVLTLALARWTSHWPVSPQANEQRVGLWKEENGEEKSGLKKIEENGRRGYLSTVGKKTERPTQQFYPGRLHAVSGRR